jgi:hypothetical protein
VLALSRRERREREKELRDAEGLEDEQPQGADLLTKREDTSDSETDDDDDDGKDQDAQPRL